ncbi:MAG: hypothetical protein HQ517_05600 [SAR324 cluster bacterium]|nr:hypothetical protein [SAR324 cluster bacterium]
MNEKRVLERKNFIFDIEVFDRSQPGGDQGELTVLGDLADVTKEGIMLISDEPIQEKTMFQLRIVLPEEIEGKKAINFQAESTRCAGTIHENIFTTGFKIKELDEDNLAIINGLITKYAV